MTDLFIGSWYRASVSDLSADKIVSSGYKYLIFGSQRTNGIELYDLQGNKFIPLLTPKDKETRYIMPVVGDSGKGFCIKQDSIFLEKRRDEIISFDLNTLQSTSTGLIIKQQYENLALSHEEERLAFVYSTSLDSPPKLGVYNIADRKIEKSFDIDRRFFEMPIIIVWKPDNKGIVLWSTMISPTPPPPTEIEIASGTSKILDENPYDYKGKYILATDRKQKAVYLKNIVTGVRKTIVKNNNTGHSFNLSRDGKYVTYGWLRGLGFETLTIVDLESQQNFQLKMDDHPSTVLGLVLW